MLENKVTEIFSSLATWKIQIYSSTQSISNLLQDEMKSLKAFHLINMANLCDSNYNSSTRFFVKLVIL